MTLEDFSNGFDTLLNSYAHQAGFGEDAFKGDITLDEYEKSLYLTQSQEAEVLSLYNGKNTYGDSFESTEEIRRYLSSLIIEKELSPIENSTGILGIDSNSKFFSLPENPPVWFITYESVNTERGEACADSSKMDVYPAKQDEYAKLRKNPFRGANNRRALRFDLSNDVIEIVCKYPVTSYYLRYLKKPEPIILIDLPDGITIEGSYKKNNCKLHESLHQRILDRAVMMAIQSKSITNNSKENR